MPITFNGNGTITGIAAGGLPDGSVQLADLATTGTASSSTFLRGDGAFAEAGGGKLLQAVTVSHGSNSSNSTTTLADTGLSASITPSATSSKILVMVSQTYIIRKSGNEFGFSILIYRGSTAIMDDINGAHYHNHANFSGFGSGGTWFEWQNTWNHTILDSPNTTSATTYKTMFGLYNTSGGHYLGVNNDGKESFMTLLEIGA